MRLAIGLIASGEVITRIVGSRSVAGPENLPGSPEEHSQSCTVTLKTPGSQSAEFFKYGWWSPSR
jgi:hypothetical protein